MVVAIMPPGKCMNVPTSSYLNSECEAAAHELVVVTSREKMVEVLGYGDAYSENKVRFLMKFFSKQNLLIANRRAAMTASHKTRIATGKMPIEKTAQDVTTF
jgi:hypothetical protein